MRRRSTGPWAWLALSLVSLLSCGGARPEVATERSRQDLIRLAVKSDPGRTAFRARYNPPVCPCPAFEIEVGGRWIRVRMIDIDPDVPLAARLARAVDEGASAAIGDQSFIYVIGDPDPDDITACATGFPVMGFELEGFSWSPPEEPSPPASTQPQARVPPACRPASTLWEG